MEQTHDDVTAPRLHEVKKQIKQERISHLSAASPIGPVEHQPAKPLLGPHHQQPLNLRQHSLQEKGFIK
jgi:hypothetical protein